MLQRAPIITTIDLPAPISVNRSRRIDWRSRAKGAAWIRHADALVLAARCRTREPAVAMPNRFELTILLSEHHTGIDLDNGLKNLIDYLRRIELIIDDSPKYMRRLVIEWGIAPEGCKVTLREVA